MVARRGRGRSLRAQGKGARWGKGWCGGRCTVMLRQPDASVMGSNTPVGFSAVQAHEESVQIGSGARVQVLAKIYSY
jgi:hypothetical protein